MDVRDGSIPGYPLSFWKDFLDELFDIASKEPDHTAKLLVRCAGGHGRTGTVLAALLVAAQILPPETDPVAWIRTHYCTEAIETSAQIQYVELLSGVRSKEMPRPFPMNGTRILSSTGTAGTAQTTAGLMMTSGLTQPGTAATSIDAGWDLDDDDDAAGRRIFGDAEEVPLDNLYVFGFPETYPLCVEYDDTHNDWVYIYAENNEMLYTKTAPWVPGTENNGVFHGRFIEVVDYFADCCVVHLNDGTEHEVSYPKTEDTEFYG